MSKPGAAERKRWLRAIGSAVRELRAAQGLSQEVLGYRTRLSQTYISQVEVGNRNPSAWSIFTLARGLGVSSSELTALAEQKFRG
jgi:transcriptional regulator with XRE-family HTH domain